MHWRTADVPRPDGYAPGVLYARVPVAAMPERGPERFEPEAPPGYDDPETAAIAAHVDADWYRAANPDIVAAGLDPVRHYARFGWREGRRPSPDFDPAWYLRRYPDIARAGIEPLGHFLAHGRAEGRQPLRPGDAERRILEAAAPSALPAGAPPAPTLGQEALRQALATALRGARGLAVSASHTCYADTTGGIELLVADEQTAFAARGMAYLHLSPAPTAFALLPPGAAPAVLHLVLNGRKLGFARIDAVREALAAEQGGERLFVLHSFLGFRAADLVALAAASGARTRLAWLHDYGALCGGFNLLRNNLAFCAAPPADSMACAVCAHGAARADHLRRVRALFAMLEPVLVAPSQTALDLVLRHGGLPHRGAVVHPNATLAADAPVPTPRPAPGTAADPVRVAFAGYPLAHKGWPAFEALAGDLAGMPAYRLHHFAAAETLRPRRGLVCVPTRATPGRRMAMVDALRAAAIDLALVISPWPETFSFVAHEAMAAGADVVTLAASGHAAVAVRQFGRGVVLEDVAAVRRFFASGAAIDYVRRVSHEGRQDGALRLSGGSATLRLPDAG